jgi:acyl carrier protein
MDRAQLEQLLRGIVVKNSRIRVKTVEDDHVLARDAGLDSLALIRTLAELEDRLGITFPVEELEEPGLLTFREVVELVSGELERKGKAGTAR